MLIWSMFRRSTCEKTIPATGPATDDFSEPIFACYMFPDVASRFVSVMFPLISTNYEFGSRRHSNSLHQSSLSTGFEPSISHRNPNRSSHQASSLKKNRRLSHQHGEVRGFSMSILVDGIYIYIYIYVHICIYIYIICLFKFIYIFIYLKQFLQHLWFL